jgi:hypothetical protein
MAQKRDALDFRRDDLGFAHGRIPADAYQPWKQAASETVVCDGPAKIRIARKTRANTAGPEEKGLIDSPPRVAMRALCLVLVPVILSSDTLTLKSGQRVVGTYAGGDARSIRFAIGDQIKTFTVGDVVQMLFDNGDAAVGGSPVGQWPKTQNDRPAASTPAGLGQQAPSQTRFVLRGDVAVDNQTHLEWKRCAVGRTWQKGQCVGEARGFTWQQAASYRESDWRAPSLEEMESLWEKGSLSNADSPHVDTNIFHGITQALRRCEPKPPTPMNQFSTCLNFWTSSQVHGKRTGSKCEGTLGTIIGSGGDICGIAFDFMGNNFLHYKYYPVDTTFHLLVVRPYAGEGPPAIPNALPDRSTVRVLPNGPEPVLANGSPPKAHNGRFTINGGEVYDWKTGLTWQRCSGGQSLQEGHCSGTPTRYTFEAAQKLIGNGWRLPGPKELGSLVNYSVNPRRIIDSSAFPGMSLGPILGYWTGESHTDCVDDDRVGCAVVVNFDRGGEVFPGNRGRIMDACAFEWSCGFQRNYPGFVRLVRADRPAPASPAAEAQAAAFTTPNGRYTVQGDEVLDRRTGLIWQRCPSANQTYREGLGCTVLEREYTRDEMLSLGGKGWRVPSLQELVTLVDEQRAAQKLQPYIDVTAFPELYWGWSPYWSITPENDRREQYRCVDAGDAAITTCGPDGAYKVRLVRDRR